MERKQETPEAPKRPSPIAVPPVATQRKSSVHRSKFGRVEKSVNPFAPKQRPKRRFVPTSELSALTYRAIRRVSQTSKDRTTFLLTYPVYGTAFDLADEIQAIFDFYSRLGSNTIQEQVASLVHEWVHSEHRKMSASRRLCARILKLARHVIPDTRLEHVRLAVEYELSEGKKRSYPSVILYNVDLAANHTDSAIVTMQPILQYPPAVLAEHLTMVDWRHFRNINNSEFFNHAWQRPDKKEKAPHLCALVQRFDQVSFWGATRVLTAGGSSKQAAVIESLLAIIEELLMIHNFNSALQLLSSLNQASVQRLKGAWKKLAATALDRYNYYDELFSPLQGHDSYRKALAAALETGDPVFPVVSVLLGDMVHIEDGNPSHVEERDGQKINMQRLDILGEQLLLVKNFQKKSYRFQTDTKVIFYLANLQGLGDEDLYQFSLKLQPTEAQLEELREKKENSSAKRINSPRKSIVEAFSAISPRAWGPGSPRSKNETYFSDNEGEDAALESDAGAKRRDVTAKKKFLPLFRNKSSQHIKEDTWIDIPHHEEERECKDEEEEEGLAAKTTVPSRPVVPPRPGLAKSGGWLSSRLPDGFSNRGELWKGGKNMEEAPPGYNRTRGLFLIGAGGRRRVGEPQPRLRRTSSVDSLPRPPADWITRGTSPKRMPPPPTDWILGGGYSPRSEAKEGKAEAPEVASPKRSEKQSKFALFRNLSSIISRPADDWELSIAEEREQAARRDQKEPGKRSEDAKKSRELRRLKKKERKQSKRRKRELSAAAPSREPSSDLSLSARSRSSSNASESGAEGKGKGKVEKFLRRAVSFVHGPRMTEEEMIVRDDGPEGLFSSEAEVWRAESERVPLSQWYMGDGVDKEVASEEKVQVKKKGLTRHTSLVKVRNFLKK